MFNRLVNWPRLVRAGTRVSVNLEFFPELLYDMRFNLEDRFPIFEIYDDEYGLLTYTAGPCQICGCCQPVQELHSRPGQTISENELRNECSIVLWSGDWIIKVSTSVVQISTSQPTTILVDELEVPCLNEGLSSLWHLWSVYFCFQQRILPQTNLILLQQHLWCSWSLASRFL